MLITSDRNTMFGFADQRVAAGEPVSGLIATTHEQATDSAIADILLIAESMPEEEIRARVAVCGSSPSADLAQGDKGDRSSVIV